LVRWQTADYASLQSAYELDSTNACEAGWGSAPRETLTPELPLAGQRRQIRNRNATCAACEESLQHARLLSDSMVVHTAVSVTGRLLVVVVRARGMRQATGQETRKMDFGFIAALVIAILAIVDLFADLPLIGGYAFWVLLGGFLVLVATTKK
jgi:hypothetical protein